MSFNRKTTHADRDGALLGMALVGFLMVALGLGIFVAPSGQVLAQTTTDGSTINVFCLDFGKTFPEGQTIKAQGLADTKIRGGLAYALSKGYVTSQPYQVQMAVWQLQDGQPFHNLQNADTTIAQEIVANAATMAVPANVPAGLDSLSLANLHVTSSLAADGTATIQGTINTQGLPIGFLLPAANANFQNLVAVVSTGSPAQATTAAATTVAATTAAPTTAPATTVATTTVAGDTAASTGQGRAPAAPSTGFGGNDGNFSQTLGMILLVAGLSVLGLAGLIGLRMTDINRQ